jgi:hypothetical protein
MATVKINVEVSDYKGSPVLSMWEIDTEGNKGKYPLLAFGKKKAQAILDNINIIQEFAKDKTNEKDNN